MPKSDDAKAREQRLAAKLRENLRRRKAQAKARSSDRDAPQPQAGHPDPEVDPSGDAD